LSYYYVVAEMSTGIIAAPYHVQSTGGNLRDGFPYFTHHDLMSAL
jgi:hypothetical protein